MGRFAGYITGLAKQYPKMSCTCPYCKEKIWVKDDSYIWVNHNPDYCEKNPKNSEFQKKLRRIKFYIKYARIDTAIAVSMFFRKIKKYFPE